MIICRNENDVPKVNQYILSFRKLIESNFSLIDNIKDHKSFKEIILAKKLSSTIFSLYDNNIDCGEFITNECNFYSEINISLSENSLCCFRNMSIRSLSDSLTIRIPKKYLNDYSKFTLNLMFLLNGEYETELEKPKTLINNDKKLFYLLKHIFKNDYSEFRNNANKFFSSKYWGIILESIERSISKDSNFWEYWKTDNFLNDKNEYDIRKNILDNIENLLKYYIFPIIIPNIDSIQITNDNFSYYKQEEFKTLEMQYNNESIVFKHLDNYNISYKNICYRPDNFSFHFIDRWENILHNQHKLF